MRTLLLEKISILCCLILIHIATFAQTNNDPVVGPDTSFKLRGYLNHLQFTPLKLMGSINPGIELGYERLNRSRWSSQLTGTYLLPRPIGFKGGIVDPDKKGFKIAATQKFYVRKIARKGFYVAGEVAYMYSRNTAAMSFESLTLQRSYKDTFEITKNNLYFSLKYGYYFTLRRVVVDFFGGMGAQYRNAVHSGRINPQDEFAGPFAHFRLAPIYNRAGRSWEAYFPLTVRIGYLF